MYKVVTFVLSFTVIAIYGFKLEANEPSTRKEGCIVPSWRGDNYCDDGNNNEGCDYDGGDCCGSNVNKTYCQNCECLDPNNGEMNFILITGQPEGAHTLKSTVKMEVLDNLGQTRLCQNSSYPLEVYEVSATYTDGKLLSCGGKFQTSGPITNKCFIYEQNNGWVQLSTMKQARQASASIPIDGGMIVTGGWDGDNSLKSSQIVLSNGSTIKDGPELPGPIHGHCLAYDKEDDVFFVTGGRYNLAYRKTVWRFKGNEKFVLNGTNQMKKGRAYHGCAIFRSNKHNGRPLLVIAGGNGLDDAANTCEYFDYTKHDSQWQLCSQVLPVSMRSPRITQNAKGDGLIMTSEKGLYKFKCQSSDSCFFEIDGHKLQIPRHYHVFLKVPSLLVENC